MCGSRSPSRAALLAALLASCGGPTIFLEATRPDDELQVDLQTCDVAEPPRCNLKTAAIFSPGSRTRTVGVYVEDGVEAVALRFIQRPPGRCETTTVSVGAGAVEGTLSFTSEVGMTASCGGRCTPPAPCRAFE